MKHLRKDSLPRHDALPHLLEYGAAMVAFLSDLGHFQDHVAAAEFRPHWKRSEIKAVYHKIFSKSAVLYFSAPSAEFLDLIIRQKAHLSVPFARMGVSFNSPVLYKLRFFYFMFLRAFFSLTQTAITVPIYLLHSVFGLFLFCRAVRGFAA